MSWWPGRKSGRTIKRTDSPDDDAVYQVMEEAGLVAIRREPDGGGIVELTEHGRQVLENAKAGEAARRELAELAGKI